MRKWYLYRAQEQEPLFLRELWTRTVSTKSGWRSWRKCISRPEKRRREYWRGYVSLWLCREQCMYICMLLLQIKSSRQETNQREARPSVSCTLAIEDFIIIQPIILFSMEDRLHLGPISTGSRILVWIWMLAWVTTLVEYWSEWFDIIINMYYRVDEVNLWGIFLLCLMRFTGLLLLLMQSITW